MTADPRQQAVTHCSGANCWSDVSSPAAVRILSKCNMQLCLLPGGLIVLNEMSSRESKIGSTGMMTSQAPLRARACAGQPQVAGAVVLPRRRLLLRFDPQSSADGDGSRPCSAHAHLGRRLPTCAGAPLSGGTPGRDDGMMFRAPTRHPG